MVISLRIGHNFLDTRPFSTGQKPLERARRQLSNGFCLVEKDLISRKLEACFVGDSNPNFPVLGGRHFSPLLLLFSRPKAGRKDSVVGQCEGSSS